MDAVNHPPHYNRVPNIECIDVIEHFDILTGTAIKYLWRSREKGNQIEDLQKAKWYIDRLIANLQKEQEEHPLAVAVPTAEWKQT